MKKTIILISAIFAALILSCEKEVRNIIYPGFALKLVIHSFLSPSDTLSVIEVTSNMRIYGLLGDASTFGNLSVTVSDGEMQINPLEKSYGIFCFRPSDLKIGAGKTYTIKAESDLGLKAVASCTVPMQRNLRIEADTERIVVDSWGIKEKMIRTRFYLKDIPGEKNYYRFFCKAVVYDTGYFYNPDILKIIGTENEFFNDAGNDGKQIFVNSVTFPDNQKCDSAFLVGYVINTDKPYFDYHNSLSRYSGGDDPFTEASPLYSNVTGGLGIVASYTADSLLVRLK